jgi:uroporphyrinogen-III decarboxylase
MPRRCRLAIASYELSGLEYVGVPFDIGVEAEAFGCKLDFDTMDVPPAVIQCNYNSPDDPLQLGRILVVLQAIRILRKRLFLG